MLPSELAELEAAMEDDGFADVQLGEFGAEVMTELFSAAGGGINPLLFSAAPAVAPPEAFAFPVARVGGTRSSRDGNPREQGGNPRGGGLDGSVAGGTVRAGASAGSGLPAGMLSRHLAGVGPHVAGQSHGQSCGQSCGQRIGRRAMPPQTAGATARPGMWHGVNGAGAILPFG